MNAEATFEAVIARNSDASQPVGKAIGRLPVGMQPAGTAYGTNRVALRVQLIPGRK